MAGKDTNSGKPTGPAVSSAPGLWERDIDDREFPILQTVKSSAIFGAYAGGAGLVTGSVIGILRSPNPAVFAIASGIGTFGIGTGYAGTRQFLLYKTNDEPRSKPFVSAAAGSLSGAGMAALTRGRSHVLPAALVWGIAGLAGQKGLDVYLNAPTEPAVENKSFWEFKWSPLQKLTGGFALTGRDGMLTPPDDDYEILLNERLLKIDARLAIIDEDVAKLKAEANEQAKKG